MTQLERAARAIVGTPDIRFAVCLGFSLATFLIGRRCLAINFESDVVECLAGVVACSVLTAAYLRGYDSGGAQ